MSGFDKGTMYSNASFKHWTPFSESIGFGNGTAVPKTAGFGNVGSAFPKNHVFGNGTAFPKTECSDNGLYGWSDENFLEPKEEQSKPKEKKPGSDRPDPVNLYRYRCSWLTGNTLNNNMY